MTSKEVQKKPLSQILNEAGKKALGGGMAGALAMVVQVVALMWMRTTINYQHANGMSTLDAMAALYAQGGVGRFYQGVFAALLQAPLSRFGDTAANAGMLALLEGVALSAGTKTLCASIAAALFRIGITPIDTFKTILQVRGPAGLAILQERVGKEGVTTLFSGALGSSVATLMGHYPWFVTYNFLQSRVPAANSGVKKQVRSAVIGFICSFTSDIISNSMRVVKTAKQTGAADLGYVGTAAAIVAQDGVTGLLFRGLGTKILSNGAQAMLFTICWRYFEEKIAQYQKEKAAKAEKKA